MIVVAPVPTAESEWKKENFPEQRGYWADKTIVIQNTMEVHSHEAREKFLARLV